ncbi:MAG TPA: hypothetical protein VIS78_01005 [Blastocatellia bacterium]
MSLIEFIDEALSVLPLDDSEDELRKSLLNAKAILWENPQYEAKFAYGFMQTFSARWPTKPTIGWPAQLARLWDHYNAV